MCFSRVLRRDSPGVEAGCALTARRATSRERNEPQVSEIFEPLADGSKDKCFISCGYDETSHFEGVTVRHRSAAAPRCVIRRLSSSSCLATVQAIIFVGLTLCCCLLVLSALLSQQNDVLNVYKRVAGKELDLSGMDPSKATQQ